MIRPLAIAWISATSAMAAAEPPDLLRFTNGDQLHGTFLGIKEGLLTVWKRDDLAAPVDFQSTQVRHVVLRGGRAEKPLTSLSNISLVNGDSLAGSIVGMDAELITLETSYAGVLRVPRSHVSMLAPSPLGGRIHYHGPFREDEWRMMHATQPDGLPPLDASQDQDGAVGRWVFSGSAWYWPSKKAGTALLRDDAMPDRAVLRFDLSWKNRLSIAIGFHADFAKAKIPEEGGENMKPRDPRRFAPGDSSILPLLFGNSYVLQLFSSHMMLFRTSVDEEGAPQIEQVRIVGNPVRLGDTGKAAVELRSSRLSGEISLFINEEFVAQWSEAAGGVRDQVHYAGRGRGFGFVVQTEDAPVKISDVMVAEWNGMPDSARSLQVDGQDIVLLANGTDRFSGKVAALEDGKLLMDARYGRFQFPLDDVAEVRFARKGLSAKTEPGAGDLIIRLSPLGRISGRPISGDAGTIRLISSVCGEIQCTLEAAVMLDFQPSNTIVDDWESDL